MEFITSVRGRNKCVVDGFIYVKQKNLANGVVSYECEKRRRSLCKAKLQVKDNIVVGHTNEHTHAPEVGKAEALSVRQSMKRRAEDTEESAQQIITQCVTDISDAAAAQMPPVRIIRRTMRRQRHRAGEPLPVPLNRQDLVIPEKYQLTHNNERFLLHDSGVGNEDRMLVFSTQKNIELLRSSDHWFMDGTFKVVPELFYQLYTIHALKSDRILPCVYALLPNKQGTMYRGLFRQLLDIDSELQPQTVLTDFELGAVNAVRETFPQAQLQGCFYHLAQCVYRKVQNSGLAQVYANDEELSVKIRMIPALAFVPEDDVLDAFDVLCEEFQGDDRLTPLMDFFEDNFIGRPTRRNGRRPPKFGLGLWNVHNRVENGLPRTNNTLEGWHRRFQCGVGAHHPTIWRFMDVLKREQALNEINIVQMVAGFEPEPQRRRYRESASRIAAIVADFPNRHIMTYLRGIAYNLQF